MNKPGLNLSDTLTLIIHEIIKQTEEFRLFDINKILVCCSSNRAGGRGGIYGKLVPLRFENGSGIIKHRGIYYTIPKVFLNNTEILYIIYFYMPKFFDLSAEGKIDVIFHELYHINPGFNGDIRRMGNFKKAHGHSKKNFDEQYKEFSDEFYKYIRNTPFHDFLEMNSNDLKKTFSKVTWRRIKTPRPVPLNRN